MHFYYLSENPKETAELEKSIKYLENSKCLDILGGLERVDVSHKGGCVVLTALYSQAHLMLSNLSKNKNFRVDITDICPEFKTFNLEFYIKNIHYIINLRTKKS